MKQLSGTDNLFLHFEKGNAYMHVASLAIYDPSTAPGGKVRFRDILRFVSGRMRSVPLFRRRLVTVPFSIDRPYWVEEPNIDVEYHVRHIALPYPGDWRQLCIQVARIHSRPLDRSKPLWEIYVIEGLDNIEGLPPGSFALYSKFHHASVDGEAGTEILKAMHALTPEAEDEEGPTTVYAEREPTVVELYARAVANTAKRVPDLARFTAQAARRVAEFGAGYVGGMSMERLEEVGRDLVDSLGKGLLPKPPATRFNTPVSAHRVVEAVDVQMADIKAIRQQVEGVTVNDVFMALVGGALHKYLEDKGELPAESLTAMVPMTLRGAEKTEDVGNQVGFTVMPVHSEIVDPIARLEAVRESGQAAKKVVGLLGKDIAASAYNLFPTALSELLSRHVVLPTMNIVVSNVRGPDYPLYMAGARLVRFLPISIAFDGLGLNVTGFSIAGTMWICAVACREQMPDPAFFAQCLRDSFAELKEAVDARAAAAERRARHAAAAHEPAKARPKRAARSRRTAKRRASK